MAVQAAKGIQMTVNRMVWVRTEEEFPEEFISSGTLEEMMWYLSQSGRSGFFIKHSMEDKGILFRIYAEDSGEMTFFFVPRATIWNFLKRNEMKLNFYLLILSLIIVIVFAVNLFAGLPLPVLLLGVFGGFMGGMLLDFLVERKAKRDIGKETE